MEIVFDSGDKGRPKGHALIYFRSSSVPDEIWVTYLVILPISVDVSKYVPPFLMNQVGELGPKDLSAFAFPPAPERLGSYDVLKEMASQRSDDILFAGTMDPTDVPSAMMSINEVVQRYAEMYSKAYGGPGDAGSGDDELGIGVNEVLYGLMNDTDKLSELTKLAGKLRFAVEGSDVSIVKEAEDDISFLARHLPNNSNINELVQAVKTSDIRGAELADLYLQRCFHLVHEEYEKLGQIENRIEGIKGEWTPPE